jgi:DNA-directed RNA polymerase specialized sigma24 family protein
MRLLNPQSAAIAELPERYRRALVAVDLLGLSYAETGPSLWQRE